MESAAGQKALPAIAFKHTTAAATVASVSAPILLDIGRDLSPSPPRPAAGDAACRTALLPAITGGEHSLALPPSAYLSHQTPLQPQIPCRLQHVIANQCAHWCGNPRPLAHGVHRKNRLAPAGASPCMSPRTAPLHPRTPTRLQHVIANQCAHWCGNPLLFAAVHSKSQHLGQIRNSCVFA